ncbi:hypothetical protein GCM10012275_44540 [Longimycelium tulufanense]|uniref:DUF6542 domain-containing protein n=1 Tax=Longimycelium tulufanense TaxID=907463 RepID=A0A8J3FVK1_9PSEU|nr:hypothetical protein GCM10012275_44540 [Longimycelium tulufanense]
MPLAERSVFGGSRGLPWWGAVLLAFLLTEIGVAVDLQRENALGLIFKGGYFVGCLLAVCWVRRGSLFGPMVQPPLLLAVSLPSVVLLFGESSREGISDEILNAAFPLVNAFPTMAVTTGVTVGVGLLRILVQRGRRTGRTARKSTREKVREKQRARAAAGRPNAGAAAAKVGAGKPGAASATSAKSGSATRTSSGMRGGSRQGTSSRISRSSTAGGTRTTAQRRPRGDAY